MGGVDLNCVILLGFFKIILIKIKRISKMKNILVFILITFCTQLVNSQSLIGIWQAETPKLSSAYLNTYQFFSDSSFKFNTNQYDDLRRIISIGGKYQIMNKIIIFTVSYTNEVVGGKIERSSLSTLNDSWAIEGGEIVKIPIKSKVIEEADLIIGKKENNISVIFIDKRKYYKVGTDPTKFN